ncbi:hypothetical protein PM082_005116 [Marasmius tenuissimus]|nr:hypothetical protein PM082_005116 [Marasmius tenuissimus]
MPANPPRKSPISGDDDPDHIFHYDTGPPELLGQDLVPSRLRHLPTEHSDFPSVPWVPLAVYSGDLIGPAIQENNRSAPSMPTTNDASALAYQPASGIGSSLEVAETPEREIDPVSFEPTSTESPRRNMHGKLRIHSSFSQRDPPMTQYSDPAFFSWTPPSFEGDPVSPAIFNSLFEEDVHRRVYKPTSINEISVLYQPVGACKDSQGPEVAFDPTILGEVGNPNSLPSFDSPPITYKPSTLANCRDQDSEHLSSTLSSTFYCDIFDKGIEGSSAPTTSHVAGEGPETNPSSIGGDHFRVNEGCRQVGSRAGTVASTARRSHRAARPPLYFCQVPGCGSQGFTAKHNYQSFACAQWGETLQMLPLWRNLPFPK